MIKGTLESRQAAFRHNRAVVQTQIFTVDNPKRKARATRSGLPKGSGKHTKGQSRIDFTGWGRDSAGRIRRHGKMVRTSAAPVKGMGQGRIDFGGQA